MTAPEPAAPEPRAWEGWPTPSGIPDLEQLDLLATDAAARALALLDGSGAEPGSQPRAELGSADPLIDAVRLLATPAGAPHVAATARRTDVSEDDLRGLVLAFRHGGLDGAAAALKASPCDAAELAAAVAEVHRRRTFVIDDLSVEPGQITDLGAAVRLRQGPDGRWYPFTLARARWWPAPGAHASASAAYHAALRARSLRRSTP